MKKFTPFLILSLFSLSLQAQIGYYDAQKLAVLAKKSKLSDPEVKDVAAILSNYLPDSLVIKTDGAQTIANFKEGNKFFIPYFKGLVSAGGNNVQFDFASSKSFLSAVGGLDVTNIVTGIAQFMIKRSKEELTITFFERFKTLATKYPEFQALFPKTTSNLINLLSFQYPEMLPALRNGFFDDIKSITYHLDDVMELPKYQALLKNLPQVRVIVRSLSLMHDIESGNTNPATIIKKFSEFKEWDEKGVSSAFMNFGSSVRLGAIFSESLRNDVTVSKDSSRAWITVDEIEKLIKDDTAFNLYLSIMYWQTKKADIRYHINNTDTLFSDIMNGHSDDLILFQTQAKEFVALAHKVDTIISDIRQKKQNHTTLSNDDLHNYITAAIETIEYGFNIARLFDDHIRVDNYAKIATTVNDIYKNIYTQQYTQAMLNTISLLNNISELVDDVDKDHLLRKADSALQTMSSVGRLGKLSFKDLNKKDLPRIDTLIRKIGGLSTSNQGQRSLINTLREIKALYVFKEYDDIIVQVSKYGMFMANIVNARTPEEVESIIESAVLPVGSSSIKKNSNFNVSVQGYLGAFTLLQRSDANSGAWKSQFGVSAPIGISFSYGFKRAGSISLFASLFDIGAIVDYQLKKDSVPVTDTTTTPVVKKDYSVKLGQIISPGAYLVYGLFGNIPLSIGLGGQYGPGLGKVDVKGATIINKPSWRWNAFLSVDIPFFTLKNYPKKYKVNN